MTSKDELIQTTIQTKALVVDGNPDNLKYLQILFTEYLPGIELIIATSVPAGLELIQRHLPDRIFLNARMKGKDGSEIFKRLKSNETTAHIPILLLTEQKKYQFWKLMLLMQELMILSLFRLIKKNWEKGSKPCFACNV